MSKPSPIDAILSRIAPRENMNIVIGLSKRVALVKGDAPDLVLAYDRDGNPIGVIDRADLTVFADTPTTPSAETRAQQPAPPSAPQPAVAVATKRASQRKRAAK